MKAGTLATVAQVKSWLGITASDDDTLLQRLVDGASAFVYSYLSLDTFAKSQYDEMYDGHGGSFMVLRQIPAVEVLAVAVHGSPLPPATGDGKTSPLSNGYKLFKQNLTLFGFVFPHCRSSVYVSYKAGYEKSEEHSIPGTGPFTVTVASTWLSDGGVTIDGQALVEVDSNPGDMEYSISDGVYTFNVGQANDEAVITYSYVPADINQAVIELVAERYKYRDRIGHSSKSLGGQETVSFQANTVPAIIKDMLNKYIRVVPV